MAHSNVGHRLKFQEITVIFLICVFTLVGYIFGKIESADRVRKMELQISQLYENNKKLENKIKSNLETAVPSPLPTPTIIKQKRLIVYREPTAPPPTQTPIPVPTEKWGEAKQISAHTWTMNIGLDDRMATPQEILEALNNYRRTHQRGTLNWDNRLAEYAQFRASYFTNSGKMDEHAGLIEYLNNMENVKKLGFWSVGENSSYGYQLLGVHLIEWAFAGDAEHDNNQLDPRWSHVGIGVSGNQVDVIFGGNQM